MIQVALEVWPQVCCFLLVVIAAIPAVQQCRMLLLGSAAFYTVGAYGFGIFVQSGYAANGVALFVGSVGGGAAGVVMAVLCWRLRGDYFALATLCFAELLRLTLLIEPPFPGPQGISGLPRTIVFGLSLRPRLAMALAASAALAGVASLTALAVRSPWGAGLQAIRDNEVAARTLGLPVDVLRVTALFYCGLWAGLAGAIAASYSSLADTDSFSLTESIMVLLVILLANRPSVARCLAVGVVVAVLSEGLRFVASGAVRQIVFGALLIGLAVLNRDELNLSKRGRT